MGIPGGNVHHLDRPVVHGVLEDPVGIDLPEADHPFPLDDAELLHLGVVIVIAARDTGDGFRDEDLPEVLRLDQFEEPTTVVGF